LCRDRASSPLSSLGPHRQDRRAIEQESGGVWGWRTPLSIHATRQISLARGSAFPESREKIGFSPRKPPRFHQKFILYQIADVTAPARPAAEFSTVNTGVGSELAAEFAATPDHCGIRIQMVRYN
jgi:hypothetical protein